MQAKSQVLWTSIPQQFLCIILNMVSLLQEIVGSAGTGRLAKSSRFERDKFTGYVFAPFVDALTDDRHHIKMRGCRYTAPPFTSSGSVVGRLYRTTLPRNADM